MNLTLRKSKIVLGGTDLHDDDPRFANMVKPWPCPEFTEGDGKSKMDIGIVGVPFDGGVLNSGGRTGAEMAPDAIREQLKKYGTATNILYDVDLRSLSVCDCGNVVVSKDIATTHNRTTKAIREVLRFADTVIVFGGGHDISYATISTLYDLGKIGGMNIDAHFDVRPVVDGKITSGTPFWRLLKSRTLSGENFFEVASQGHVNSKAHYDYLLAKKAKVIFLHDIRIETDMWEFDKATKDCDALFVSVDMDAVAQAFAPGVSAPSPDGLFPADILRFAYLAGQNPRVRLFEIMEMNPLYDIDGKTARLAANIVLEFCAGRATTKSNSSSFVIPE